MNHQHHADPATQRVVLAVARHVLGHDYDGAVAAAQTADCPACATVAAIQFGFALADTMTGPPYANPRLARMLADAVEHAQRELDATTGGDPGLS